jgi:thiol-disulfide isomerase/thioredoxin
MATSTKQVITELNVTQLQALQGRLNNDVLILKFSADWCGPCKKIAPTYQMFMSMCPSNIIFGEIDVDENIDLWMALKKQKMVQGIPVFLAFFGGVKRQLWFIPDDSVVGADEVAVTNFFKRCANKAVELANKTDAYTYYS